MSALSEISVIIDKHRAKNMICCPESCWCWGVEASICGYIENNVRRSNEQINQRGRDRGDK